MASDSDKKWNRPWSMEEIIGNAENWSLAGDVALLNSIKAYADNLLTKTLSISNNVDELLNGLNEVGLKLEISQNEFQSLRNTQFIESRVYEDDETLDVKEEVKEETIITEEAKQNMIKEATLEGLRVMDKYFDKIEVSISDSEEESEKSYVLQPKDLYMDRPLPLVIGTEDWYKKWHVGLADTSSEEESDKASETYSDSDSDDHLPKDLLKGSETSSELDFSSQTSENRPVANSTFNESAKQPDIFESDESDEQGPLPVKVPVSNKNFAEQLAEKLGNVISEREDLSVEVNKRPIQPAHSTQFPGGLFSDEPPPLDDFDDTILPKSVQSGLFSGGQGLFDDNDDELFWEQQGKLPKTNVEARIAENKQEIARQNANKNVSSLPKSSQVSKGLFDSENSSDDDLFLSNKKHISKPPFLQPYKATAPLFDDEPPELDAQEEPVQQPIETKPTGVSSNLFLDKKNDALQSEEAIPDKILTKELSRNDSVQSKPISLFDDDASEIIAEKTTTKKINLFDDDDDLFKDDLFSNLPPTKATPKLFNIEKSESPPKVDLFKDLEEKSGNRGVKTDQKGPSRPRKVISLFSDDEDEEEEENPLSVSKTVVDHSQVDLVKPLSVSKTVDDHSQIDLVKPLSVSKTVDDHSQVDLVKPLSVSKTVDDHSQVDLVKPLSVSKTVDDRSQLNLVKEDDFKGTNDDDGVSLQGNGEQLIDSGTNGSIPERQVIGAEKKPAEERIAGGLFDDDDAEPGGVLFDVPPGRESPTVTPQLQVTVPTPEAPSAAKPKVEGISLFDSTPPPYDGDDWDVKSDNFSDEDQFSYRIDGDAAPSSLFDNEPPSLGPDESSGIVRDHNVTRVDTDDSSFYPYASSSRRLSSDIFSEQQSQDSLFVTKSKTESINVVPPPLDIIPEHSSKVSYVDVTPSGHPSDLEAIAGNDLIADSVFENLSEKPKKLASLFDDNDYSDPEDLFYSKTDGESLPKLSEKRLSLFGNVSSENNPNVVVKNENNVADDMKTGETDEGGTKSYTEKNKVANLVDQIQSESSKEQPSPLSGSPRKLKHNLNINVNALLPGYAPPKLKELTKSHSLDLPKEREGTPSSLLTPDTPFFTPQSTKGSGAGSEKAVSFEDALDDVEVLRSVTKDRARIPIKRRPSTRRGRREAISKSTVNLPAGNEEIGIGTDVWEKPKAVEGEVEPRDSGKVETESSKKDSHERPTEIVSKVQPEDSTVQDPPPRDIFKGEGDSDEDLFPNLSQKSSKAPHHDKPKATIFDSGDSDVDLFGSSKTKKAKKRSEEAKNNPESAGIMTKKSLFNDSSSDDDLFSAPSKNLDARKTERARPTGKKTQKSSTLRKLENIQTDDDPLSSLLK